MGGWIILTVKDWQRLMEWRQQTQRWKPQLYKVGKRKPLHPLKPFLPDIVFDRLTGLYHACPRGDWWQEIDERRYALLFWVTPEIEQQLSRKT